jgi:hypothetical protein
LSVVRVNMLVADPALRLLHCLLMSSWCWCRCCCNPFVRSRKEVSSGKRSRCIGVAAA